MGITDMLSCQKIVTKIVFSIIFFITNSTLAFAAEHSVYIGVLTSNIDVDSAPNYSGNDGGTGYRVGWSRQENLANNLFFVSGILFSRRSFEFDYVPGANPSNYINDITITADYLDLPMQLSYKINKYFSINGGILVGVKINDSCSNDSSLCDSLNFESTIVGPEFGISSRFLEKFEFGISFFRALGYLHKSSNGRLDHPGGLHIGLNYYF